MKTPAFQRPRRPARHAPCYGSQRNGCWRNNERGVTMVLVALCMIALIAMAAMSIDVVTLYLNRQEAQRAADAAALAAARVISLSGITGTGNTIVDTTSWDAVCGGSSGTATQVAQQVGAVNTVGGSVPSTVTVKYSAQGATGLNPSCSSLGQSFAINPSVTVQVTRTGLPTMFSRIWSRNTNTVSATATAEAFNSADSGTLTGGDPIPVVPRCVKPFMLADEDPGNAGQLFVSNRRSGRIITPGIKPTSGSGVIGENFTLSNNCGTGPNCTLINNTGGSGMASYYIPTLVNTATAAVAVPGCAIDQFQDYVAGCDYGTVYACGTVNGAQADLTQNRGADTSAAIQCLINAPTSDTLNTSVYPFQITAGSLNPLASAMPPGQLVSTSNSIITVPLFNDRQAGLALANGTQPNVTIVGYLQLFVNNTTDNNGDMSVTVLNVSGCGDTASTTQSAPGSSPVPIRLITPQ